MPSSKVIFINVTANDTIYEEKRYKATNFYFRYGGFVGNLGGG